MTKINKVGYHIDDEYSDMPIDWDRSDIQVLRKWDENTIRNFLGLPPTFTAIYRSIVDVNDLDPKADNWEDFDWNEFKFIKRGFPPVVLVRTTTGKLKIADGNHRIYWAQQSGYKTIGAWVVDKLIQQDINRRNKRHSIQETRIITLPESLYEGYITLYHGTIYPIALKAKKDGIGPQNLEDLVVKVLIDVFHEKPIKAKEYFDKYAGSRKNDPSVLFLTTNKENAKGYAKANTKFGGEIFLDVIGSYIWNHRKKNAIVLTNKFLKTDKPAVVTVNVPLTMVFTHPHWNTPLRSRIRQILDPRERVKMCHSVWEDITQGNLRMEVFVKDKIPARFIQRIDSI